MKKKFRVKRTSPRFLRQLAANNLRFNPVQRAQREESFIAAVLARLFHRSAVR